jgi:allantoinase
MSSAPARLANLPTKGELEVGRDADLVVFDPEAPFTIEPHVIQHRHPVTPYLGQTVAGRVMMTVLRGRIVYQAGKIIGAPGGELVMSPVRGLVGGSRG